MTNNRETAEKLGKRIVDGCDLVGADPYYWFIDAIEKALDAAKEEGRKQQRTTDISMLQDKIGQVEKCTHCREDRDRAMRYAIQIIENQDPVSMKSGGGAHD